MLGGLAISAGLGLTAPLWIGAVLAGLGLLSMLPYLRRAAAVAVGQVDPAAAAHDSVCTPSP
jgi:hypothetical protein